jgi:hypothetical protein
LGAIRNPTEQTALEISTESISNDLAETDPESGIRSDITGIRDALTDPATGETVIGTLRDRGERRVNGALLLAASAAAASDESVVLSLPLLVVESVRGVLPESTPWTLTVSPLVSLTATSAPSFAVIRIVVRRRVAWATPPL